MTLTEVHDRPELLARYLGVPFAPATIPDDTTHTRYPSTRTLTAEEYVAHAYARYRQVVREEWNRHPSNPYRGQTWGQFLAECLREGLGIKRAGKLADKLDYARISRPDLYRQPVAEGVAA